VNPLIQIGLTVETQLDPKASFTSACYDLDQYLLGPLAAAWVGGRLPYGGVERNRQR
jgi:hypothetical protein